MTSEIAIVLTILAVAVILFVSERIRIDLVALMVMVALALTGLITPAQALSGFSNSAVVTVWAVFILSGGLSRTGIANVVGRQVLRLAGRGEVRLIFVIMLTTGVMSAFMNNIGVVALMLPVVVDIARRLGHPPSKLLIPLSFGCLIGGGSTLIGTPPNILASNALRDYGLMLGTGFQIIDDVLDFRGDQEVLGKPVGSDLREGIVTLPVLYYWREHPDDKRVPKVVSDGSDDAMVREVVADIQESGAVAKATDRARTLISHSQEVLSELPDCESRTILHDLANYTISRNK